MSRGKKVLAEAQELLEVARDMEFGPEALLYASAHVTLSLSAEDVYRKVYLAQESLHMLRNQRHPH